MSEAFMHNEVIAAHVPVVHRGYLELIDKYPQALVGVLDESVLKGFDYLRKDIRALRPEQAVQSLEGLGYPAQPLGAQALQSLMLTSETRLVMPYDDISDKLIAQYGTDESNIVRESIFLRWDRNNTQVNVEVTPDRTITLEDDDPIIKLLGAEADKSSDWWRHVSTAVIKDTTIVTTSHNHALPTEYSAYIDGDPRITQSRGTNIEASLFIHSESDAIAQMAKEGISTEGTSIYVSTFPCPNCAKLIASSGIKQCYYVEGYAMVDGLDVMKSAGVEVIKIDTEFTSGDNRTSLKPYPSS